MSSGQYQLRKATFEDRPALQGLIARSARELSSGDYRPEQVEGALRGAFGVDTQLIQDGTYFVVELAGKIVACGGWSYRRTLFGGDARAERDATELDPRVDPAKIRAFFVDPDHARRGIGTLLLERCEAEARARGFRRVELMSTLPGRRLYAARGYKLGKPLAYRVGPDCDDRAPRHGQGPLVCCPRNSSCTESAAVARPLSPWLRACATPSDCTRRAAHGTSALTIQWSLKCTVTGLPCGGPTIRVRNMTPAHASQR